MTAGIRTTGQQRATQTFHLAQKGFIHFAQPVAHSIDENLRLVKGMRGQYKLIREIGEGGFALAYEAIDQQTQKTVAIKLLIQFLLTSL